ncbi:hypothetical protein KM043_013202 [Ampulex compressa]|nr:hypothetical protein KM043_013202 [Ampulex compressa]
MATASNTAAGEASGSNVPQWKRDLIQRRRQQNKVLAGNGASVKLCTAMMGPSTTSEPCLDSVPPQEQCGATLRTRPTAMGEDCVGTPAGGGVGIGASSGGGSAGGGAAGGIGVSSFSLACPRAPSCGAIHGGAGTAPVCEAAPSVACNMRLEADLSLCSDQEDVVNGASSKYLDMERKSEGSEGYENEEPRQDVQRGGRSAEKDAQEEGRSCRSGKIERDLLTELSKTRTGRIEQQNEDGESDSSEELQYGPGIVNKLKSKYLNLTLREMNKNRATVQRFRRAASLEDLLDCEDEPEEKNARKYTKRNSAGVAAKADRYRNASRGNESMKRARSVETLMRYNATDDSSLQNAPCRLTTNGLRQEPVNDHIILIDRTTVKIESRLGELDRPKAVNKPKRIKPLLAETERPPPDLVKTTMRIFEGSARRLKPKGEVAAKVATFKTINDTFKNQPQKKVVPKPPIQPKPFINGNTRAPSSPKKMILLPQKPTAELIEAQDGHEYHMDGVITEPIVSSVSSVVSKFQQIEKSLSPSPSPEPPYKLRFSPAPSPEPPTSKLKSALEINVKSPPVTPVLSPRISSPRLQSPPSPIKDVPKQTPPRLQSPPSPMKDLGRPNSSPVRKLPPPSPNREPPFRQTTIESPKLPRTPTTDKLEQTKQQAPEQILDLARKEDSKVPVQDVSKEEESKEDVDGPRTISKTALDNIGKAGVTMQFSFSDKPNSGKSYLPGAKENGQKPMDEVVKSVITDPRNKLGADPEGRLRERLEPERNDRKIEENREETEVKANVTESKPIGAISSLGLVKSSTTTTSYAQGNECKTIRSQKLDSSPPQKQIGIIRPLVSTKTQHPQQNLSNRELEKNLINRVKSIEQPTKVVVSLKSADEIQPAKKTNSAGGGLWDTKPWNQQNNTMVFNFSNRKDVPDYIENDGLIIKRKREKPKVGEGGIIVLDATLDASTTDDSEWEISGGPPSPCDVSFLNDNVLINGRSNLSRTPRNHKHRIQFDDTATRTFEYPSEASMLEGESSSVDGEISCSMEQSLPISNKTSPTNSATNMPSLLGGGGLASYTPSKVDLTSEGFELGVTRTVPATLAPTSTSSSSVQGQTESETEVDYLKPAQDAGAWGSETTGDLLY